MSVCDNYAVTFLITLVPKPLVELHIKLLRKLGKSVTTDRWEKYLAKVSTPLCVCVCMLHFDLLRWMGEKVSSDKHIFIYILMKKGPVSTEYVDFCNPCLRLLSFIVQNVDGN